MSRRRFQFAPTSPGPVTAGALVEVGLRASDPNVGALSRSAKVEQCTRALNAHGLRVLRHRADDAAGLVTPSLIFQAVVVNDRRSLADVAQGAVDVARRCGLVVNGANVKRFEARARRRVAQGRGRAGLRLVRSPDYSDTLGELPAGWTVWSNEYLQQWINANLDVRALQTALNAQPSNLARLAVDGVYGPLTRARVREFQASRGFAQTGSVDSFVYHALFGGVTTTAPTVTQPGPVQPPGSWGSWWGSLTGTLADGVSLVSPAFAATRVATNAAGTVSSAINTAATGMGVGTILLLAGGAVVAILYLKNK
jgi:hypothetical protein